MSADEFSVEFDILFNNISSNQAPGLTLLEKSIFLTQGKEIVIKDLYSGKSGPYEVSEEVTEYLSKLTKQANFTVDETEFGGRQYNFDLSELDPKCWYIVYEQAKVNDKNCVDDYYIHVTPISHNDFAKAIDNPFRGPDRRTVLRLNIGDEVQLYCSKDINLLGYSLRYLCRPSKIYLDDFNKVDHESAPTEWTYQGTFDKDANACEDLPESLHRIILMKAVQLAQAVWQ